MNNFFLDTGQVPEGGYIPLIQTGRFYKQLKLTNRHLRENQPIPSK